METLKTGTSHGSSYVTKTSHEHASGLWSPLHHGDMSAALGIHWPDFCTYLHALPATFHFRCISLFQKKYCIPVSRYICNSSLLIFRRIMDRNILALFKFSCCRNVNNHFPNKYFSLLTKGKTPSISLSLHLKKSVWFSLWAIFILPMCNILMSKSLTPGVWFKLKPLTMETELLSSWANFADFEKFQILSLWGMGQ